MIGDGHAAHAVLHGFVDQPRNAGLTVENGILGVYVKVYEVLHKPDGLMTKIRGKVTPHRGNGQAKTAIFSKKAA